MVDRRLQGVRGDDDRRGEPVLVALLAVCVLGGVDAGHGRAAHAPGGGGVEQGPGHLQLRRPAQIGGHGVVVPGPQAGLDQLHDLARDLPLARAVRQGPAVGHQAGLGAQDGPVADQLEAVLAQGDAGLHDVHDDVPEADAGRRLDAPFGGDDGEVGDAPGVEEALGEAGEGGHHPQGLAPLAQRGGDVRQVGEGGDVQPALGDGQGHRGHGEGQVLVEHEQVAALGAVLLHQVHPGDADVDLAVRDLGQDVPRPLHQHQGLRDSGDVGHQLPVVLALHAPGRRIPGSRRRGPRTASRWGRRSAGRQAFTALPPQRAPREASCAPGPRPSPAGVPSAPGRPRCPTMATCG